MKKIVTILLSLVFSIAFLAPVSGQDFDAKLFEGAWTGKWVSDKAHRDNAPMKALIQVDIGGTVSVIMFQVPEPPAPTYSSLSIGKIERGRIVIHATTSGIGNGETEMTFWLENPLLLKGTYKNEFDRGIFEFRRSTGKEA